MSKKLSEIEKYQIQREPLNIDKNMKKGAEELEKEDALRSGDKIEEIEHKSNWQKELNEKMLREDHDNITNSNFPIK